MKGQLLPEKYRVIFCNKQVVAVEYENLKETDERDIFKRVQLGMALTDAEKLQAISTPRANFARHLVKTFVTPDALGHPDIAWDHSRGRDFKMFVIVIFAAAKWNKKTGLAASIHHDTLRSWLAEGGTAPGKYLKGGQRDGAGVPVSDGFKKDIIKTCETVVTLATTRKYNFAFRSSPQIRPTIPVLEVAGAFILVYAVYVSPPRASNGKVSLRTLSSLFTLLRIELRTEHENFIANSLGGRAMVAVCLEMAKDPAGYLERGRDVLDELGEGPDLDAESSRTPKKRKKQPT
ncbi:hypothetical protein V5O48_001483 [Marasmius crinis-equi]|uniref:Nucleoprotein n=1 Tax=Marasmius crinis-equi TaxID=585013 RepID=A0ABR3FYT2_9AGAR